MMYVHCGGRVGWGRELEMARVLFNFSLVLDNVIRIYISS